jgi:hypothetical protein
MTFDGRTVDGNGGSFQWSFEGGSMNADTFGTELDFKEWYEVPAGASISTEGTADTIKGWVDSCCDTSSPPPHVRAFDLANGDVLPSESGRYVLEFTASWPQGSRTFFFPVKAVIPPEQSPAPATEPSAESAVAVPDVIGLGDQQSIQALIDAGLEWDLLFRDVPGDQWKAATSDPAARTLVPPGSRVVVTIVSRVTPLPAGAADVLGCPANEQVAFGSPHMVRLPAGEAFIANVGGIRSSDAVTRINADWSEGLWQVVRDGAMVAIVDYGTLDGVACAGSGIAGA